MTPKKYPQNFIPKKFLFFLKTQKNIEIQNFEPQKMDQAYVCMKISEDPPPAPPPPPPPSPQISGSANANCHFMSSVMILC